MLTPVLARVPEEHLEQLRRLACATKIPQAALLREAVEDLLAKYLTRPRSAEDVIAYSTLPVAGRGG